MGIGMYVVSGTRIKQLHVPCYRTILVGKHENSAEGDLTDAGGDSIAEKNPYYCELTALYWLWKNQELEDIVGMCHYRRFFDLQDLDSKWVVEQEEHFGDVADDIHVQKIEAILQQCDIVLPTRLAFEHTIEQQYCKNHRHQDWDTMKDVLKEMYPEYVPAAQKVFQGNSASFYNMFITRKEIFLDYMKWLFDILFEVEKRIEIPYEDKVQRRVFGYLSERLLNVYVEHHHIRIKEQPIIFLANGADVNRRMAKNWKYKFKRKYPAVAMRLKKIKDVIRGKDTDGT